MNVPAESAASSRGRLVVADAAHVSLRANDFGRQEWVRRCASRLGELCFHNDREWLLRLASELWEDVPSFDPVMAAELEHESWLLDD